VTLDVDWITVSSYVASALVFVAFFMQAIIPLRSFAIASNIFFIVYALGAGNHAILILHTALFPLNILRVVQHIRLIRRVREAAEGDPEIEKLLPLMAHRTFPEGTVLFNKGDLAEEMYFLSKGRVLFPEFGVEIETGTLFGEIALFLNDRGRTASAVCAEPCEVFALSHDQVLKLVLHDPAFGIFLTKLVAVRLHENLLAARSG
jgi:CRP/FNR family cyclic AMP-dependent transcriptional regulator